MKSRCRRYTRPSRASYIRAVHNASRAVGRFSPDISIAQRRPRRTRTRRRSAKSDALTPSFARRCRSSSRSARATCSSPSYSSRRRVSSRSPPSTSSSLTFRPNFSRKFCISSRTYSRNTRPRPSGRLSRQTNRACRADMSQTRRRVNRFPSSSRLSSYGSSTSHIPIKSYCPRLFGASSLPCRPAKRGISH